MTPNPTPLRTFYVAVLAIVYLCNSSSCKYCPSVDVRAVVSDFDNLKGCRIIVGNLQVVLFDRATPETFRNISFPELEEVTGYVVFFLVPGLKSIGAMFPNLKIIRGMEVLHNFAFIIYDLADLEEVGFM